MLKLIVTSFVSYYRIFHRHIYNYYELAVQKWCSTDYMIHGLWPQINSTAYPVDCKTVTYSEPVRYIVNKYECILV